MSCVHGGGLVGVQPCSQLARRSYVPVSRDIRGIGMDLKSRQIRLAQQINALRPLGAERSAKPPAPPALVRIFYGPATTEIYTLALHDALPISLLATGTVR